MGMRLHYETKHIIEYSLTERFTWCKEQIVDLLSEFDVQMFSDEDEDASYSDNFYCPREEIEDMVKELRGRNPNERCFSDGDNSYTNGEVADFFGEAVERGEKNSEYIYFSWF